MFDKLRTIRVQRDTILFAAGLVGVLHETLIAGPERPTLLYAFVAMMGLPLVLRDGDRRRDRSGR